MMGVTWTYALLGAATLLCGAMGTILMKVQFSMTVEGTVICRDGATNDSTTHCPFHKPWFGVLQMKIAMTMCLIYLLIRQKVTGKPYLESPVFKRKHFGAKYMPQPRSYEERRTLLQEAYDGPSWRTMLFLVFPALLDLINTTLAFTGLLWVPASVYQMSNGAVLLFSAFIAMRFMGRDLYCYQILSILLVAFAVIIFSVAGILGGDHNAVSPLEIYTNITTTYELPTIPVTTSDVHQAVGMAFILLGQVALAAQFAVEEHFMVERHVSPLLLVGMEGAWGLVLFIGLVPVLGMTPASDAITAQLWHEDFSDTWVKLKSSPSLLCLVLAYMLSIGTYNIAALYVTKYLSSIVRSMLEIGRTVGVWMVALVVYYILSWNDPNSPGEAWSDWSWVQLFGFALLVLATLTYKKSIHFPCLGLYQDDRGLPISVPQVVFLGDRR
ncbi:hypothetical protein H310_01375 [Aphanomyces invadans]|uniref:EamA domain-containing protein n=1 Tax=Aphanomyces invadans TaxID=157072 RepID=A0A024URS7_9STRA|nr:hypothetical protein H310_01375 [Aphanomyces invadans]ETW08880.1 hypothetical protein H310_01375 [Aphanomyces invadans]|eukprot:XP_008862685.1 hypothetical protein H310_01375 [Aphanomyces invadans]